MTASYVPFQCLIKILYYHYFSQSFIEQRNSFVSMDLSALYQHFDGVNI